MKYLPEVASALAAVNRYHLRYNGIKYILPITCANEYIISIKNSTQPVAFYLQEIPDLAVYLFTVGKVRKIETAGRVYFTHNVPVRHKQLF